MAIDAYGNVVPDTAPGQGALPAPLGTSSGQSRIDPALSPYLQMGLQRAQQLFFGAQPQLFPGQMYVSPSAQTQQALAEAVAEEPHVVAGPVTDKLMRFRPLGWYGMLGFARYREASLYRIESSSSINLA